MTKPATKVGIEAAAVTDRGLNERRPLNEDSYLVKPEHGIFAVADGVGGAEAGEVASQTAIEVLEEAFRNQRDGEDVEDLLEIAVQRANASIHRMSREHPKFAMMATTVVALHIDGLRATVGHVGDSRLYRVAPGGQISRETEDHSVVEEEVRAGRMTPEQAQTHPSRNVISRALGAEPDVEVDLNVIEVEPGTTFLICTDGITRHISDQELASIVGGASDLQAACEEMKSRCFERGAEDNLTAVLVRVGGKASRPAADTSADEEQTIIAERRETAAPTHAAVDPQTHPSRPFDSFAQPALKANGQSQPTYGQSQPPSRSVESPDASVAPAPERPAAKSGGGFLRSLFFLILVGGFSAAAFYGGMLFEQQRTPPPTAAAATPVTAVQPEGALALGSLELDRNRVDSAPVSEVVRMEAEMGARPENADDPRFLYLYGRALLLSGKPQEALQNFEKAVGKIQERPTSSNARLIIDARLATAAASLRSNDVERARAAVDALGQTFQETAAPEPSPTAGATVAPSPDL